MRPSAATCRFRSTSLHFEVFTAGATDADRALIAQNLGANDILTVNAGTYHIVSYFGEVNAIVRADLKVEAGQLTDATLYHKAAQVSFKLVSEAGGEAIADVDWTVKSFGRRAGLHEHRAFPRRSCRRATTSFSRSAATRSTIESSRFRRVVQRKSKF